MAGYSAGTRSMAGTLATSGLLGQYSANDGNCGWYLAYDSHCEWCSAYDGGLLAVPLFARLDYTAGTKDYAEIQWWYIGYDGNHGQYMGYNGQLWTVHGL